MAKHEVKVPRPVPSTPETTELRQQFNFLLENVLGSTSYEDLKSRVSSGNVKTIGIDPSVPGSVPYPVDIDTGFVSSAAVERWLIYRPSGGTPTAPNVYTDFKTLMDAANSLEGRKVIDLDNTGSGGNMVLPAHPDGLDWDFTDCRLASGVNGPFNVDLADGFSTTTLHDVSGLGLINPCIVTSLSSSPIIDLSNMAFYLFMVKGRNAITLQCDAAAAPFFDAVNPPFPGALQLLIVTGGAQGLGGHYDPGSATLQADAPLINIGSTSQVYWICRGGTFRPNTLSGSGTFVRSLQHPPFWATNIGLQPSFTGTTFADDISRGDTYSLPFPRPWVGAEVFSSAETFALVDGQTLTVSVDGGGAQTATFNTVDFSNIALATAAEVAAVINTDITGVVAADVSGTVRLASEGTSIEVTGGTANGELGFSTDAVGPFTLQVGTLNELDTNGNAFTLNLPAASQLPGIDLLFKDIGGNCGTNNVTLDAGSDSIINLAGASASTFVINANGQGISLRSADDKWLAFSL